MNENAIEEVAGLVRDAAALLVTAGAGMGVDSGLPDFRGDEGFWNAYPPYRRLGRRFVEMANPRGFARDPLFAWGFYGHRLRLYRETVPHEGFSILRRWGEAMRAGCFVMTSNVDGHFEKAGFPADSIYEVHGSIHHLQCSQPCPASGIWSASALHLDVDESTMRAGGDLPRCPECGVIARPNILMFGDVAYRDERNADQHRRLSSWLHDRREERFVILEIGAGSAVPTVRLFSEEVARTHPGATLVRINPREPEIPLRGHLSLPGRALDTLVAINRELDHGADSFRESYSPS